MAVIILGSGVQPVIGTRTFYPIPFPWSYWAGGSGGGVSFLGGDVNNYVLTSTGAGDEIQGEPNLTFNGTLLRLSGDLTMPVGNITVESMTSAATTSILHYNTTTGLITYSASGGGTTNFLRADGTWADPVSGTVGDDGTGTTDEIAVWTSATQIGGYTGLTYDDITLTVATADVEITAGDLILPALASDVTSYMVTWDNVAGTLGYNLMPGGSTQYLRADGTWAVPPGTLGVSGTAVDNQVAVWVDATTLEGDSSFTFDGGLLRVDSIIETQLLRELTTTLGVRIPNKLFVGADTTPSATLDVLTSTGSNPAVRIDNDGTGLALDLQGTSFTTSQRNTVTDAETTTITRGLDVLHTTSSTAAAGFGTGIALSMEYDSGATRVSGAVDSIITDATYATGDARLSFKTLVAGVLEEVASLTSDGYLLVDTINELTSAAGVTIEGVLLEDSDITLTTANYLYFETGAGTYIYDNAGVMTFEDSATGPVTLATLASSGLTVGTEDQIPHANTAGTNFDYSAGLTFDGTNLLATAYYVTSSSHTITVSAGNLFVDSTGTIDIDGDTGVLIEYNAGAKSINMDATAMTVTDTEDSLGLYYAADYSAGATARWIPDKDYVDTAVGAAGGLSASGTPANDQVAVWVTASTLEGTSSLTFTAGTLDVNSTITVDTINEHTALGGVTIEGVLIEDSDITLPVTTGMLYFGDGDTYIYESSDDNLTIYVLATQTTLYTSTQTTTYVDILPNADRTLDLGGPSNYWQYVYADRYYVNSGAYIDFDGTNMTFTDGDVGTITLAQINSALTGGAQISGTPADNRVAVWVSSTAIEGDSNFTYDGSTLTLTNSDLDHWGVTSLWGADFDDASTRTNSYAKQHGFLLPHYTITEEDFRFCTAGSTPLHNFVEIGGGSVNYNAATRITFYSAATTTTTGGTVVGEFNSGGLDVDVINEYTGAGGITINNVITMPGLGSDDTEDHVIAIDDTTGLLTKRSVTSIAPTFTIDPTPVDNQIAVWSGATSIGGGTDLTWDGTDLVVGTYLTYEDDIRTLTINGGAGDGGEIQLEWNGTAGAILGTDSAYAAELYSPYHVHIYSTSVSDPRVQVGGISSQAFLTIGETDNSWANIVAVYDNTSALVFSVQEDGDVFMTGLTEDSLETYVVAIDDSTGLLSKRSVASLFGTLTFTGMTDTPSSYAGSGGYMLMVNSTPDAVEFVDPSGYGLSNFNDDLDLVSITNQADNRVVTATGTTNVLNAEANMTFDGSALVLSGAAELDHYGWEMTLGGDIGSWLDRTDATVKLGLFSSPHYTNAEEDIVALGLTAANGLNTLQLGGGNALRNAMSQIQFYAAATSTTLTGTKMMEITTSGVFLDDIHELTSDAGITLNDNVILSEYGSGTYSGTAAYNLSVDASGNIIETSTTAGDEFVELIDTPANYTAAGGYMVMVNSTPDALEFINPATYNLSNFNNDLSFANWGTATNTYIVLGSDPGDMESDSDFRLERSGDSNTLHVDSTGATGRSTIRLWDNGTNQVQIDSYSGTGARIQTPGSMYLVSTHATTPRIVMGDIGGSSFLSVGDASSTDTYVLNLFASGPTTLMRVAATGAIDFNQYGSGTFTGTAAKWLAVDSSGNLIEEDAPGGGVGWGTATNEYIVLGSASGDIESTSTFSYDTASNVMRIGDRDISTTASIGANDGTVTNNQGLHLDLYAGDPYNTAGADAGHIYIKGGDARTGDSGSSAGFVALVPGTPYQISGQTGYVYIGDPNNSTITSYQLLATGEAGTANVGLIVQGKGTGACTFGASTTTNTTIRAATRIYLQANELRVGGSGNTIVRGLSSAGAGYSITYRGGAPANGSDYKGGDIKIEGYAGGTTNGDGGDVYVYGGAGAGSGSRGSIYMGDGSTNIYLPNDEAETNLVAIDATTGLLSYRSVASIGGGVAFGTSQYEIPFTNATTDDFDYTPSFTYDDSADKLILKGETGANNFIERLSIYATTSTTPGSGLGSGMNFYLENSANEEIEVGRFYWRWGTATDGSETGQMYAYSIYQGTMRHIMVADGDTLEFKTGQLQISNYLGQDPIIISNTSGAGTFTSVNESSTGGHDITIKGGSSSSSTGTHDAGHLHLQGGAQSAVTGGDGGNVYIQRGTAANAGSNDGSLYFGNGSSSCSLENDETETNLVAIDTSNGLLTYRSVASIGGGISWGTATLEYIVLGSASGDIESSASLQYNTTTYTMTMGTSGNNSIVKSADGSTADGTDLTIKSGDGDASQAGGDLILLPGDAGSSGAANRLRLFGGYADAGTTGLIDLGDTLTNTADHQFYARSSSANSNITFNPQGAGTFNVGGYTSTGYASIYGLLIDPTGSYYLNITRSNANIDYIVLNGGNASTIAAGYLELKGGNGSSLSVNAARVELHGGDAYSVSGDGDGGDVFIYGGAEQGTGAAGQIYFGESSKTAPALEAKGSETNVVYYNTTSGLLTYGTPAGGGDVSWGTATSDYITLGSASGDIESSSALNFTSAILSASREDAGTTTSIELASFDRTTSATPADGLGGYVSIGVEELGGSQHYLRLEHILTDISTTSEDSMFRVTASYGGSINQDFIAIAGSAVTGYGANSVAMGPTASASAIGAIAIGTAAAASTSYSISIGENAGITSGSVSTYAISIGESANSGTYDVGQYSVALGAGAVSSTNNTISIGRLAGDTSGTKNVGSISIGGNANQGAYEIGFYAIAIGNGSISHGDYSVAIGFNAADSSATKGDSSISIGENANAGSYNIGQDSIAIGANSISTGAGSISIGYEAGDTSGTKNGRVTTIGYQSNQGTAAAGAYGVAIGDHNITSASGSTAIGRYCTASAQGAIIMGYHGSEQTNTLTDSFKLMWDGTTGFHAGLTLGTQITVNADPDTNLTAAANGSLAYDSTDHQIRAYVNSAWTALSTNTWGTDGQVPYMNGTSDFTYTGNFAYNDTTHILSLARDSASNNLGGILSLYSRNSVGAGGSGLGSEIRFYSENASSSDVEMATILVYQGTATAGSETSTFAIDLPDGSGSTARRLTLTHNGFTANMGLFSFGDNAASSLPFTISNSGGHTTLASSSSATTSGYNATFRGGTSSSGTGTHNGGDIFLVGGDQTHATTGGDGGDVFISPGDSTSGDWGKLYFAKTTGDPSLASETTTGVDERGAVIYDPSTGIVQYMPFTKRVTLTQSQIQSLNTTPIEVIPAPGTGKFVQIIAASVHYDFATSAFSGGTYLRLVHGATSVYPLRTSASFIQDTSDRFETMYPDTTSNIVSSANTAVNVTADADSTGGAASSDFTIDVVYRILDHST
jgi:hypothetical protein